MKKQGNNRNDKGETSMNKQEVLNFWFEELTPNEWFQGTVELDKKIKDRFKKTLIQARAGELAHWRETIEGRLAEIIVLDQFSRNIYRDKAEAFASDDMALALAQEAVLDNQQQDLPPQKRAFLYMPFMHSESLKIQENYALRYFKEEGLEDYWPYAKSHYETIKEFGRFPYRNETLNRETTSEEQAYLDTL